jgi:hypothetical protein
MGRPALLRGHIDDVIVFQLRKGRKSGTNNVEQLWGSRRQTKAFRNTLHDGQLLGRGLSPTATSSWTITVPVAGSMNCCISDAVTVESQTC